MQPAQSSFCEFFGFIFVAYCTNPLYNEIRVERKAPGESFEVQYQWSYVNFTWPSLDEYTQAVHSKRYIPENNVISGIKFYKDRMYLALPRPRSGTPVTLASISTRSKYNTNVLLTPFPSWGMNVQSSCASLQNVQSMEIDRRGIMWVLDGMRIGGNFTTCPPKLILLDLNERGKVLQTYTFRGELCARDGGFLNDLVLDESDGGYAYISESSNVDPGLIVYSRQQGRAWKLRDKSMFAEESGSNFTVDGVKILNMMGIDGIALSPLPKNRNDQRLVYYAALNGLRMYAISTKILKNEAFCGSDQWRRYVKYVGKKTSPSDGLFIDNEGFMYFGLIRNYGVGKWDIYQPFNTAKQIDYNPQILDWVDGFGMDSFGNLYTISNGLHKYFDSSYTLSFTSAIKFRVFKLYTGNKNYMYTSRDYE